MIEFDRLLNYCDSEYQNSRSCHCGESCTNGNYCLGEDVNCYKCIKRVHDYHNSVVHYNCEKMLYYYVLKHGYRFAAEVFYLLQKIQRDITQWDNIYITSIGCGPCTELFGSLFHWRSIGKLNNNYHFRGFDLEPMWSPLMRIIPTLCNGIDVQIQNSNAFEFYKTSEERVDIIVLNYMLSDMLKFHPEQYSNYLDCLCGLIQEKHPKYLLINDVYLKVSINASLRLLNSLAFYQISFKHIKLRYHGLNSYIGEYGRQIDRQPYEMRNPKIVDTYDPFRYVDSIQTIIKFQ